MTEPRDTTLKNALSLPAIIQKSIFAVHFFSFPEWG